MAGLTAWQSLLVQGDVGPGRTVFVHAAAGGVGHFAVQLARQAGARVLGTARVVNHEFVLGMGAERVIDYSKEDFGALYGGFVDDRAKLRFALQPIVRVSTVAVG